MRNQTRGKLYKLHLDVASALLAACLLMLQGTGRLQHKLEAVGVLFWQFARSAAVSPALACCRSAAATPCLVGYVCHRSIFNGAPLTAGHSLQMRNATVPQWGYKEAGPTSHMFSTFVTGLITQ